MLRLTGTTENGRRTVRVVKYMPVMEAKHDEPDGYYITHIVMRKDGDDYFTISKLKDGYWEGNKSFEMWDVTMEEEE